MATTPERDEQPTRVERAKVVASRAARPRNVLGLALPVAAALAATAPEPLGAAGAGVIALAAYLAGKEVR